LDAYDFARGLALLMDQQAEKGLLKLVTERRDRLQNVTDSHRPYRVLAHLIVDSVPPEAVGRYLPAQAQVTVREAARILTDIASHTRATPQGVPVVYDRDLHLLIFKSVFVYYLDLLAQERYGEKAEGRDACAAQSDEPEVNFVDGGVVFNPAAYRRWCTVIGQPPHFQVIADFLKTVPAEAYPMWYFRVMAETVRLEHRPDANELKLRLDLMRRSRPVN